ncbi:hypothetical protein Q4561_14740 [Alteromonas sp. 1_MG-2023]|uniref:hypothetical protein n=1 Tax=Alteromonas sp. 1_MG-2023 TaxID=3062669 RepID=UPI0026E1E29B|nr:hypothetical protein [Alteromonas sp. 1_MG-2023]MDO6568328.1 hypothetical protein [Alteromonas sp. 1_MG-2023]
MIALLSVILLSTSLLATTVLCFRAIIHQTRKTGMIAFWIIALFFFLVLIISPLRTSAVSVLEAGNIKAFFFRGVFEECLKGFCVLFYCSHPLTLNQLKTNGFTNNILWPFALFISMLENWQIFLEPIISTILYLNQFSQNPEVREHLELWLAQIPAVQYYSTSGLYLLATSAFTRILIHFGLLWFFVYFWTSQKKSLALCISALHGLINFFIANVKVSIESVHTETITISALYITLACLFIFCIKRVRKSPSEFSE